MHSIAIDDVSFAIISRKNVITKEKAKIDSIVLYKEFDEKRNDFEGEFDEKVRIKILIENGYCKYVE